MHDHEAAAASAVLRAYEQAGAVLCGYADPADVDALVAQGLLVDEVTLTNPVITPPPSHYPARAVFTTLGPLTSARQLALSSLGVGIEAAMAGSRRRGIVYDPDTYCVTVPNASAWEAVGNASFAGALRPLDPDTDVDPKAPY